jgi:pimeloyl-ACP methyl ester carboxylesterase
VYESGPEEGEPLILLHGNVSSGRFFEELMAALPEYRTLAPDLRGFGASDPLVVDATRGVADYADDLHALVEALGLRRFHLLGWSLGGNVAIHYLLAHPDRLLSTTLLAPGSPYGYGGTQGPDGRPNFPDFAGSGAGLIGPEIRARLQARDTGLASLYSPRSMLRHVYVRPPSRLRRQREDALVEQILLMALGDSHYPGDSVRSPNWPYAAPGVHGPNNAVSPKYLNQRALGESGARVPILWVRGASDRMVSDAAYTDPGTLGSYHLIARWPGPAVFPPQPMLLQTRAVLRRYKEHGGPCYEVILPGCGHSPHLERPEALLEALRPFLRQYRPDPHDERRPDFLRVLRPPR